MKGTQAFPDDWYLVHRCYWEHRHLTREDREIMRMGGALTYTQEVLCREQHECRDHDVTDKWVWNMFFIPPAFGDPKRRRQVTKLGMANRERMETDRQIERGRQGYEH